MGWASGNRWYRQKITISGTNVAGDVTDFPVAVNIPAGNDVFTTADTGGTDILFTEDDGETFLDFERSVWDKSGSEGVFYVKATLSSGSDNEIYIYYGGTDLTDFEDAANVWDSDFDAIWHFEDGTYSGSANEVQDSSGNGNHGRASGGVQGIDDTWGQALNVTDSNDFARFESNLDITTEYTISCLFWIPLSNSTSWHTLTRGLDPSGYHQIILQNDHQLGNYQGGFHASGFDMDSLSTGMHHVAVVRLANGTGDFYVDGSYVGNATSQPQDNVYAVGNYQNGGQHFGQIDEFRVSASYGRNATWLAVEAENLLNNSTFISSFATREVSPYLITTSPHDQQTFFTIGEVEAIGGVRQILTEYTQGVSSTVYYDMPTSFILTDVVSGTSDVYNELYVATSGTLDDVFLSEYVELFVASSGDLGSDVRSVVDDFTVGGIPTGVYGGTDVDAEYIQGHIVSPSGVGEDVDVEWVMPAAFNTQINEYVEWRVATSNLQSGDMGGNPPDSFLYDIDIYSSTYSGVYNVDHWELFDYVDSEMATLTGTGGGYLWPFPTDVYSSASGSRHPFDVDVYVSLANTVPSGQVFKSPEVWPVGSGYYFGGEMATSGTITGYEQDVYVSLESLVSGSNQNTYKTDMRLHALEVDNFFLEVDEYTTSAGIMSVDIYDKRNIPVSTANSYFVVSGTQVPVTFSGIEVQTTDLGQPIVASGYRMFFDSPSDFYADEPLEIVAHGANIIGDIIEQTYYLLYGYNLIYDTPPEVVWGWGDQIIVWATAKNKASCPAQSTDAWWFEIRPKEYADLGATIVPTGYANLPATIYPQLQPNSFFYGAKVKVIVRAKDEAGNEMEPFVLNFTIEDNPN